MLSMAWAWNVMSLYKFYPFCFLSKIGISPHEHFNDLICHFGYKMFFLSTGQQMSLLYLDSIRPLSFMFTCLLNILIVFLGWVAQRCMRMCLLIYFYLYNLAWNLCTFLSDFVIFTALLNSSFVSRLTILSKRLSYKQKFP